MFGKWVNARKTAYICFEQRGSYGTDHGRQTYGTGGDQFTPRRPLKYGD